MVTSSNICPHVRPFIKRDLVQVIDIEEENNDVPWRRKDFYRFMAGDRNKGVVAEYREQILGFMLFQIFPRQIILTELSVKQGYQRRGVGTELIEKLYEVSSEFVCDKFTYYVLESNLPAQLFMRSNEFKAVKVHRGYYEDVDEDVYEMELPLVPKRVRSGFDLVAGSESR